MNLQRHQAWISLLTQHIFTAGTLPEHVDTIRKERWNLDLAAREPKHTNLGKRLASSIRRIKKCKAW
jgi:hypothetical protein